MSNNLELYKAKLEYYQLLNDSYKISKYQQKIDDLIGGKPQSAAKIEANKKKREESKAANLKNSKLTKEQTSANRNARKAAKTQRKSSGSSPKSAVSRKSSNDTQNIVDQKNNKIKELKNKRKELKNKNANLELQIKENNKIVDNVNSEIEKLNPGLLNKIANMRD
jgi:hypothetical protein